MDIFSTEAKFLVSIYSRTPNIVVWSKNPLDIITDKKQDDIFPRSNNKFIYFR